MGAIFCLLSSIWVHLVEFTFRSNALNISSNSLFNWKIYFNLELSSYLSLDIDTVKVNWPLWFGDIASDFSVAHRLCVCNSILCYVWCYHTIRHTYKSVQSIKLNAICNVIMKSYCDIQHPDVWFNEYNKLEFIMIRCDAIRYDVAVHSNGICWKPKWILWKWDVMLKVSDFVIQNNISTFCFSISVFLRFFELIECGKHQFAKIDITDHLDFKFS